VCVCVCTWKKRLISVHKKSWYLHTYKKTRLFLPPPPTNMYIGHLFFVHITVDICTSQKMIYIHMQKDVAVSMYIAASLPASAHPRIFIYMNCFCICTWKNDCYLYIKKVDIYTYTKKRVVPASASHLYVYISWEAEAGKMYTYQLMYTYQEKCIHINLCIHMYVYISWEAEAGKILRFPFVCIHINFTCIHASTSHLYVYISTF